MNVQPAKAATKAEYAGQIIISAPRPATRRLTPSRRNTRAAAILKERRETLECDARELLARETLGEEDLNRLRLTVTGMQAAPAKSGG